MSSDISKVRFVYFNQTEIKMCRTNRSSLYVYFDRARAYNYCVKPFNNYIQYVYSWSEILAQVSN